MMDAESIRITRRIMTYMMECAEQQVNIELFKGLGLSLAVCYEEMTGRTASNKKPKELMQWALSLPAEKYPRVTL